ncbi:MAG TPA: hypothetical protein VKE94_11855 [Gemmataceae bacterium]|nr:hypothetical protein [Gemmataceae bacterium]
MAGPIRLPRVAETPHPGCLAYFRESAAKLQGEPNQEFSRELMRARRGALAKARG